MRKICLFLLPLVCAIPLVGQVSVFQLSNTVTPDGTITGTEWDDASVASNIFLDHLSPVTGLGFSAPGSASDLSGTVRLKWDTSNLYALFQISDDVRGEDSADGVSGNLNSFNDDSVELNFSDTFPDSGNLDGVDRLQFRFNPNTGTPGNQEIESSPLITSQAGITWGTADTTGSNYVVEVSIPWSTLGVVTPTIGNSYAFIGGVNDDDGNDTGGGSDTDREHQLFWNSTSSTAWDDATQWSEIQLTAAIPEPSTYAMVFGLIGLASVLVVKKRKSAATAA